MKKLILLLSLLSITSPLFAGSSCYSLYEKKSEEIRKKKAHDVQIGGELVVINGELAYYPGITVPAKINNWAENLLSAIKYGPELYGWSEEYPKKDWLDALYNSIENAQTAEQAILIAIANHGEDVVSLISLATGKPVEFFDTLDAEKGLDLAMMTYKINQSFFVQHLIPKLQEMFQSDSQDEETKENQEEVKAKKSKKTGSTSSKS